MLVCICLDRNGGVGEALEFVFIQRMMEGVFFFFSLLLKMCL